MPESNYREQAKQLADEYNVTPPPIAEKATGERAYQAAFTEPADYDENAILVTVWLSETVKEMTITDLRYALLNEELTAIEAYPYLSDRPSDEYLIKITDVDGDQTRIGYHEASSGDIGIITGMQIAKHWVVAQYDPDQFFGRDLEYLVELSLFGPDGENRADELGALIDSINDH